MLGGVFQERWFATHAQYFVKFLQAYANAGVKVRAVTVNNEVDTDQDGHFPATVWAQQHEMVFVAFHLGPALEKASLDSRIWAFRPASKPSRFPIVWKRLDQMVQLLHRHASQLGSMHLCLEPSSR